MTRDGYLRVYECPRELQGHPTPGTLCGYISSHPGECPYDHGEPVALVEIT